MLVHGAAGVGIMGTIMKYFGMFGRGLMALLPTLATLGSFLMGLGLVVGALWLAGVPLIAVWDGVVGALKWVWDGLMDMYMAIKESVQGIRKFFTLGVVDYSDDVLAWRAQRDEATSRRRGSTESFGVLGQQRFQSVIGGQGYDPSLYVAEQKAANKTSINIYMDGKKAMEYEVEEGQVNSIFTQLNINP